MSPAEPPSPEHEVLRARARGEVSADASFERLYAAYAADVRAWFRIRMPSSEADDLVQDVWVIFHHRWRRWDFRPEMDAAGARPVLSFLYRTAQFVLHGHRRRQATRAEQSLEGVEQQNPRGTEHLHQALEASRCLSLARRLCPAEELDVLLPKLAGVPAREIARTLGVTEPVVDHRFRNALGRIKAGLAPRGARPLGRRHGR
ncbi:MAG: RNA polymerase sigma factor [Vicinamibacteria bacterium]